MSIYFAPPPHERLSVFFGEFFREMRKAPPEAYGAFLARAEEEFKRLGYREKISSGVENILILRFDSIGDVILTSGFIRELRKNFPKARITLIVMPNVYPIVEFCPYVNEILTLDVHFPARNEVEVFEKFAIFCRDHLWKRKFSVAVLPRWRSDVIRTLQLAWMSGARERIGYGITTNFRSVIGEPSPQAAAIDNFFMTKIFSTPQNIIHDAAKNFYLLAAIGLEVTENHMELWYNAEDFQYAKELLEDLPKSAKKIILGIGGSLASKKYPVEKYLIALKELAKKDLVFVIVGSKDEIHDAEFLEKNLPSGKILNLVGKTTLRQCEAVTAQADFYIGNDTSNIHMAAASKLPTLGIYKGAKDRESFRPMELSLIGSFFPWQTKSVILCPEHPLGDCATLPPICGWCHHDEAHCITQITPQEIIDGFEKLEEIV